MLKKLSFFLIVSILIINCQKSSFATEEIETLWKCDLNNFEVVKGTAGIISTITYDLNKIYCVAGSRVIAINRTDGKVLWIDNLFNKKGAFVSDLEFSQMNDSSLYLFGRYGLMTKLDKKDGAFLYGKVNKKTQFVGEKVEKEIVESPKLGFYKSENMFSLLGAPASGIRLQTFNFQTDSVVNDKNYNLKLILSQSYNSAIKESHNLIVVNAVEKGSTKGYIKSKNLLDIKNEVDKMNSNLHLTAINKSNGAIKWSKKFKTAVEAFDLNDKNQSLLVLPKNDDCVAQLLKTDNSEKISEFKFKEYPVDVFNKALFKTAKFYLTDKSVTYISESSKDHKVITQNLNDGKVIFEEKLKWKKNDEDLLFVKRVNNQIFIVTWKENVYKIWQYKLLQPGLICFEGNSEELDVVDIDIIDGNILLAYSVVKNGSYGEYSSPMISLLKLNK